MTGLVSGRPGERRLDLDAVKGLLVLLMILYHWLNYFVTTEGEIYKYLRFVTPSFIFLTGFLITNVSLEKYRIGERGLHGRLLVRGVKLVALFTALNLTANLAVARNYDGRELGVGKFVANAASIYLSGDGRGAAFEVLVPIGYLLVAASVLLWGCTLHRQFLVMVWGLCLGGVYALKSMNVGSGNAELLTMGVLGMMAGQWRVEAIERAARPTMVWLGAYAVYLVALSVYDVRFELQVVGLVLNMVLLSMAARALRSSGAIAKRVIVLGQYPLLAYIAHIGILQVLARVMRPADLGASTYVLSLVGALVLTYLSIEATRWGRSRSPLCNRLYRVVLS